MTFLKKILLIDNEPVTGAVRLALEQTGKYLIKEEHDSRLAVNAARWFQPDLILFDVLQDQASATSVARKIREDALTKDTPVMFVSANTPKKGRVVSGGILSGYTFLAAPVPIEEFVGYVGELLSPASR